MTMGLYTYADTFGYESREIHSENLTMNLSCSSRNLPYIYRLPFEMLARIFEIGTHGSDDPNDPVDFPVQIAAVSRHFRAVACGTPCLWTTVNFYSPRPSWYHPNLDDDEYEYTYTRDRIWLERSRACPLDLVLSFRDLSWNFNEDKHYFRREHMEHILSLLSPHSHRLRRFTLICDTFAPLHAALLFFAAHGSVMQLLETLELYRCNEFSAEYPMFYPWELAKPIPLLGGNIGPKLTRVVLSSVHVDWNRSKLPLSNLTTLDLAYHSADVRPSVSKFADILRGSSNLTSLVVIDSGPSVPPINIPTGGYPLSSDIDIGRVHLSHLTTFKLGYRRATDALTLIHLIDAPSIIHLTIKDTSRPSEDATDGGSSILAYIANPRIKLFPRLRTLTLETVKTTTDAFTACLDSCPKLQTLELDHVSREALFVLALPSPSSPSELPCPALKQLSLRFMSGLGVGTVVKKRKETGMALDTLSIYFRSETRMDEHELALAKSYCKVVNLFDQSSQDSEKELMDWGENDDPYALGGVFNDPEFDAIFS